ncbi:hypothetical protein BC829DRAFT_137155 [Chytridium lagenaria]|nr:hypothetical protein BC829DRAFT_137155 [Chytridium lagenaria]
MSGQFVGLAVRLFLKNQSVIEGRVLAIDDETQLITLENATIKANGSSRTISTHHVPGQEIADLHILKAGDQKATPTSSPANPAPPVNLAPPTFAPVQNYHAHPQMNPHPVPSMAIPGNHAPPLQPHPQGNLPSPAPGQLPMPPSGLMHHHHQMHPMPGHYHPGAMPITQQQLFGMGGMV